MKQDVTRALYDYWNGLRGARAAPERNDVDPTAIAGALADAFVLEIDPDRRYPIRLAGARFCSLTLRALRGEPFVTLFDPAERAGVRDLLAAVADDARPAVAGVRAAPAGFDALDCELLLLPLRHHGATHARLLGALTPTRTPSWIGLLPVAPMRMISLRLIDEEDLVDPPAAPPKGVGDFSFTKVDQFVERVKDLNHLNASSAG